jgi:hypothetical protein
MGPLQIMLIERACERPRHTMPNHYLEGRVLRRAMGR